MLIPHVKPGHFIATILNRSHALHRNFIRQLLNTASSGLVACRGFDAWLSKSMFIFINAPQSQIGFISSIKVSLCANRLLQKLVCHKFECWSGMKIKHVLKLVVLLFMIQEHCNIIITSDCGVCQTFPYMEDTSVDTSRSGLGSTHTAVLCQSI